MPVAYSITDDFGLADASLEIEADGRKLTTVSLDSNATTGPAGAFLATTAPGRIEGATLLDLARLDLQGVKRLTLRVAGTDRRPAAMGGPGRGVSRPCVIEIDARAPSLAEQVVGEAENELRELIDGTIEDLKDAEQGFVAPAADRAEDQGTSEDGRDPRGQASREAGVGRREAPAGARR